MFTFTLSLLCTMGTSAWYPSCRRLDEPQNRCWNFGEEKNSRLCRESCPNTSIAPPPPNSLHSIRSELSGFIILTYFNDKRECNSCHQLPLHVRDVFHSNLGRKSGLRLYTHIRDPEKRILYSLFSAHPFASMKQFCDRFA
jgi:hypothetical protein